MVLAEECYVAGFGETYLGDCGFRTDGFKAKIRIGLYAGEEGDIVSALAQHSRQLERVHFQSPGKGFGDRVLEVGNYADTQPLILPH